MSTVAVPLDVRSPVRVFAFAAPVALVLLALPYVLDQYQTILLAYGLVMAIAALGFNLLLGYTGLLSFGHSAYFGVGAYVVALMVKYLGIASMELFLLGAIVASVLVTALFGFVREAGITYFPEVELAVLYLMAAAVLLVRPAGLFGRA